MRKVIPILAALLLADAAQAGQAVVRLCYTIPTTRQNGQPMAITELKGYKIYYTVDSSTGPLSAEIEVNVPNSPCTSVGISLADRAQPYQVYWAISAVDTNGLKSPLSAMVMSSINMPLPPQPPATPVGMTAKFERYIPAN